MSGSVVLHVGDAAAVLRTLPMDSVNVLRDLATLLGTPRLGCSGNGLGRRRRLSAFLGRGKSLLSPLRCLARLLGPGTHA